MSFADDLTTARGWLSTWTATPKYERSPEPPTASSDPASPSAYIVWRLCYERVAQVTFGGTKQKEMSLEIGIWVQEDASEDHHQAFADQVVSLLAQATPPAGIEILHKWASLGDVKEISAGYAGKLLTVPVNRFEEAA